MVVLIIVSATGPSRCSLIFPTKYRLKWILRHNSAMCAPRQHVESNITLRFLGGSSLGEIEWSPTLIDISDILLSSLRVIMIISSVLSSFDFKKLSFREVKSRGTQLCKQAGESWWRPSVVWINRVETQYMSYQSKELSTTRNISAFHWWPDRDMLYLSTCRYKHSLSVT